MSGPQGRTLFVWETPWPGAWPDGYDAVCVKAADGRQANHPGGFGWADNANAWHNAAGGHQVGVWVYCYPGDGADIGSVLKSYAPWADYVVLDVEDASNSAWTWGDVDAIVDGVHTTLPGVPIGYCTYPTADQARSQGVPFDQLKVRCDFAVPQVYYPYQGAQLDQVFADNGRTYVAVEPDDDPAWSAVATESIHRSGAVFVWHAGTPAGLAAGGQLPQPSPQPVPVPVGDPLRPTAWLDAPWSPWSVVWDGTDWWVTDMIWRRPASEDMVLGLVASGAVVRWWPGITAATGLVSVG